MMKTDLLTLFFLTSMSLFISPFGPKKAHSQDSTPGSLSTDNVANETVHYHEIIKTFLNENSTNNPIFVGHRLGQTNRYPENLNNKENIKNFLPIKKLMDISFNEFKLGALEFDLRYFHHPESTHKIFVSHDPINKDLNHQEGLQYLKDNSFINLLTHYVKQNYHKEGKKLYIELKSPDRFFLFHPMISVDDEFLYQQIFLELQTFLTTISEEEQVMVLNNIGFASFNFYALKKMHGLMEKFAIHMPKFFLIMTTDSLINKVYARLYGLPVFNSYVKNLLIQNHFVTGVWFDPTYMKNPIKEFNKISSVRKTPLEVYINTYFSNEENFIKKLEQQTKDEKIENFAGIIFDILAPNL